MFELVKEFWKGVMLGIEYNKMYIRESKWYIIPFVINIILVVPIIIILLLACFTEKGRRIINAMYLVTLEEMEG
jgi:hypothetical protein